jgi:tetratricopeptide (TPR) repeat protein
MAAWKRRKSLMMLPRGATAVLTLALFASLALAGPKKPARKADKMAFTGLAPSTLVPNLCKLHYRISTPSEECQAFFDQGLGYFYSYVWMEAARSFETALQHDPECPLAWWGLSRALERWGRGDATKALLKADALKDRASHREQQLILASMQEKGHAPSVGDAEERKRAAVATLDNLIAVYEDDEEAWYFRAQLAGGAGLFGGTAAAVPFYKALVRINPLHPGANHELLHFYENIRRPALGWIHAERYIESSPGIPHPFHMQAHLATRLGRWDRTTDRSAHAIELQRAYHKDMNVEPGDDGQYSHHLEILLVSLTHDGRFREARAIETEARRAGYKAWQPWYRLHVAARDWGAVDKLIREHQKDNKSNKTTPSYMAALAYLEQGLPSLALPHIEVLQHARREHRRDKRLELDLWEVEGLYMCQTGGADAGLKLLARAVERTKDDYSHHAWGNGAYYMEAWGKAALQARRLDVAEEAFLEALAHDPGSVRGALGMQVLCEEQGRTEEARRFAALAHRCWGRADAGHREAMLAEMRKVPATATAARTDHAAGTSQRR